jgi:hypothetical protein
MTLNRMLTHLSELYPTARIRGRRMTRLPEKCLDWVVLNAATAHEMGRDQVGWFVGNHPGLTCAAEQFGRLDMNPEGGVWVVVALCGDTSLTLFDKWPHTNHVVERPGSKNQFTWRSQSVWVAVPEGLKQLVPLAQRLPTGIAGVIVYDRECIMYKARGGSTIWGWTMRNDRPQHVVDFRAAFNFEGWQPPLLLLTSRPAKSVNTDVVARAFCLNAFQFIAGDSFGCWDVPVEEVTKRIIVKPASAEKPELGS